MTKINYIITDNNITVNYLGQTHIVPRVGELGEKLIEAIKSNQLEQIPNLVSVSKRISNFSNGKFVVKNDKIYVDDQVVCKYLGDKILNFSQKGLPFEPLIKFAQKLQKNPSFRAVNELYQFLEKNNHPITENGNFIAYKRVRGNFTDIHSGTFDNSVGNTVQIARNEVDEDPNRTCSNGLHVANWDYAHNLFASSDPKTDLMLEVEVDPADVVAIPNDYNQSKMRVCKYVVVQVVDSENSCETDLRYTNRINDRVVDEDNYPWDDELDSLDEDDGWYNDEEE